MQISIPVLITAQIAQRAVGIVLFIASPCIGTSRMCWRRELYLAWQHQSSGFPNRNKKNNKQQNPFSQEFRNYDALCFFCIVHFFCLLFSQRSLEQLKIAYAQKWSSTSLQPSTNISWITSDSGG